MNEADGSFFSAMTARNKSPEHVLCVHSSDLSSSIVDIDGVIRLSSGFKPYRVIVRKTTRCTSWAKIQLKAFKKMAAKVGE